MNSRRMIANPEQASLDFGHAHEYRIRSSRRARYLRINVHPDSGIEVVVPHRMSLKHVEPFVRQHRQWIDEQVEKLGLLRPRKLPDMIHLAMVNQHWQTEYKIDRRLTNYRLLQQGQQLIISGPNDDLEARRTKLLHWLRKQARLHLPERLEQLALQLDLGYGRVSIRSQRTRWGSCSSVGNINLNDRLMFLPAPLADYVMVHELCHTRHMNHSKRFWQLVESHVPQYRKFEKQLRSARQLMPGWI